MGTKNALFQPPPLATSPTRTIQHFPGVTNRISYLNHQAYNMKSLSALLLALLALSNLTGCSEDPVPSGGTIQQLFPLTVGNSWTLQQTIYDDAGNVINLDTTRTTVDSAGTVFGHSGFHSTDHGEHVFFYYQNGIDFRYQNIRDETDNHIMIRYPMAENEILVLKDTTTEDGYRTKEFIKLISENTSITVPAGSFNCVTYINYYLYGNATLDTTSYTVMSFAFGKGLIQRDSYRRVNPTLPMVHENNSSLISSTIK